MKPFLFSSLEFATGSYGLSRIRGDETSGLQYVYLIASPTDWAELEAMKLAMTNHQYSILLSYGLSRIRGDETKEIDEPQGDYVVLRIEPN